MYSNLNFLYIIVRVYFSTIKLARLEKYHQKKSNSKKFNVTLKKDLIFFSRKIKKMGNTIAEGINKAIDKATASSRLAALTDVFFMIFHSSFIILDYLKLKSRCKRQDTPKFLILLWRK
jgi:hypothetical protein